MLLLGLQAAAQVYTIQNPPPITNLPFPNTLWNKPLPSDTMQHLAVNSDTIANASFTGAGGPGAALAQNWWGLTATVTSASPNTGSAPLYYGQSTDPVYAISSCSTASSSGINNAVGQKFHFPNGACMTNHLSTSGDSYFAAWDQTSNLLFAGYNYSGNSCLPTCPGSHACTLSDPMPTTMFNYCGMGNWSTEPLGMQIVAGDSLGNGGWVTHIRDQELMQGSILHALYLESDCVSGTPVFPMYPSNILPCSSLGVSAGRPPAGGLMFFDYTNTQLADIKTKVPAWQYPFIEAMTKFGGYVGDTNGYLCAGCGLLLEGPQAYEKAGLTPPLIPWLTANFSSGAAPLSCSSSQCTLSAWMNIPLEGGTDVTHHVHMADPCVPLGLAGQAGGCVPGVTPLAPPTNLTATPF